MKKTEESLVSQLGLHQLAWPGVVVIVAVLCFAAYLLGLHHAPATRTVIVTQPVPAPPVVVATTAPAVPAPPVTPPPDTTAQPIPEPSPATPPPTVQPPQDDMQIQEPVAVAPSVKETPSTHRRRQRAVVPKEKPPAKEDQPAEEAGAEAPASSTTTFGLGATMAEVKAILGPPSEVIDLGGGAAVWDYDTDSIHFENGKVTEYDNSDGKLPIR